MLRGYDDDDNKSEEITREIHEIHKNKIKSRNHLNCNDFYEAAEIL
jgi:hypothetical protein